MTFLSRLNKIFLQKLSVTPVSSLFGFDRGQPIDRHYIEDFLKAHKQFIKGDVVEIGEATYTKLGGNSVTSAKVLSVEMAPKVDLIVDLVSGEGLRENIADCIILTQTLSFVKNPQPALQNTMRMLKPGGCVLVTVPGIVAISSYDYDRWGQYWSFTDMSIREMIESCHPAMYRICTYGNVKAASAFLFGLASHEIGAAALKFSDPRYQIVICAYVQKTI